MMHRTGLPARLVALSLSAFLTAGSSWAGVAQLLPLNAGATGPRVLVISVGIDGPSKAAQEPFDQAAQEAVLRSGRFELVAGTEAFEGSASKMRSVKLNDAMNKVKEGKKFLDDLDNQAATESFIAAISAFRETDLSKTFPALIDAIVLKSACHATGGEMAAARSDIERVVAMRPGTEFPAALFPPELIKYAETQKKIASSGKGELSVATEPSGARVYVDGLMKGTSPVVVKNLPAGKHFVTATLTGYYLNQKEVGTGSETLTLLPSDNAALLAKAVSSITKESEGPGRDSTLRALGEKFQVPQVLAVVSRKSLAGEKLEVIVERIDVKDGHNLGFRQGTVPMDDADAVGVLVDSVLAKDAAREGGPVTHFQGGSVGSGRKVAGYSLLGAGAAFLAVGIVSGLQAQSAVEEYRATPQLKTVISQNIATRGRTFSVVADVSYLLAAASVGTGAYLAFSNPAPAASSGEAEPEVRAADARRAEEKPVAKREDPKADKKKADAAEAKRAADAKKEADAKAKEDADAKKKADTDKQAEADRKAEADKKAADEEQRKKDAEAKQQTPAQKKAEEARKRREEAEAKAKEAAEKRAEADRQKKEEAEAKKKAAEDARKDAEAKKKEEAEAKQKAAEDARKDADAKKKADADKKAEDERAKKEAADARKKPANDGAAAAEAKKKEEAEAKAREEEARRKADEDKRAEEERKKKEAEKKKEEDDLRNY